MTLFLISSSTCIILTLGFLSRKIVAGEVGNISLVIASGAERYEAIPNLVRETASVEERYLATLAPACKYRCDGVTEKIENLCYTPPYAHNPFF